MSRDRLLSLSLFLSRAYKGHNSFSFFILRVRARISDRLLSLSLSLNLACKTISDSGVFCQMFTDDT